MFQVEENEQIYNRIIENVTSIVEMKKSRVFLEVEKEKMLNELKLLIEDLSTTEENQDILTSRNMVVREKFNHIDEDVKEGADKIKNDMKTFFKKLGLKLSIDRLPLSENLVELKLQLAENHDYRATFVYDSITEDYDLTSLHPEHPRFPELRNFLQETKDIQGFLFNFRNSLHKSVNMEF